MRSFFLLITTIIMSLTFMMTDAQAGRFGGGRSFGVSRSMNSFSRPQSSFYSARNNTNAYTNTARSNRWLGPLAGLAIGSIIGSLLMGHGFASGILSWLLLGGVILFVMNALRMRKQHMQMSTSTQGYQPQYAYTPTFSNTNLASFEDSHFLREAKAKFLRLQTAYDQKNLQDIREFSTPEVCAEIQLQLQERGNAFNQTEVVNLDAEVLDVATETKNVHGNDVNMTIASVKFSGLIRENASDVAASFCEIWHFQKDARDNWLVAGIQQN